MDLLKNDALVDQIREKVKVKKMGRKIDLDFSKSQEEIKVVINKEAVKRDFDKMIKIQL